MSNEELRKQIYGNLILKETDELLKIWQVNNRSFWSDDAFEVIKGILKERGAEIPEQNEPVYKMDEETLNDDGLDEWEVKALDIEDQPEFYDTLEVITLKDNINKTTRAVIVFNILGGFTAFQFYSSMVQSYFPNREELVPLIYLIAFIVTALGIAVSIALTYFPLKALTHILRILMEMEFRSRKAN